MTGKPGTGNCAYESRQLFYAAEGLALERGYYIDNVGTYEHWWTRDIETGLIIDVTQDQFEGDRETAEYYPVADAECAYCPEICPTSSHVFPWCSNECYWMAVT